MSTFLTAAERGVFDQIDETTFWAIAGVYRAERQRGEDDATAFDAGVAMLGDRFPMASRGTITVVTRAVLARATPAPLDWLWE